MRGIASALLFIVGYVWLDGWLQVAAFVAGGIALVTAVTGFCGLYRLLDIDTLSKGKRK